MTLILILAHFIVTHNAFTIAYSKRLKKLSKNVVKTLYQYHLVLKIVLMVYWSLAVELLVV